MCFPTKPVALFLTVVSCLPPGLAAQPTRQSILVFEQSTRTVQRLAALLDGGTVYLPISFLVSSLKLEAKDLAPDIVGMCREDLCIPLRVNTSVGSSGVSAPDLFKGLGGSYLWDAEAKQLFLNMIPRPTRRSALLDPVDLSLPNLQGEKVRLSDFRGKKVALFAWASW
jgi:hypothetical protein